MPYRTDATRSLVDAICKAMYGMTASKMVFIIETTIANLYSKRQLSIDEIAEIMGLEASYVHDKLKKQKLVKGKRKEVRVKQ